METLLKNIVVSEMLKGEDYYMEDRYKSMIVVCLMLTRINEEK